DAVLLEIPGAAAAEHDRPVLLGVDEHPADVPMGTEGGDQVGMPHLELLERHSSLLVDEVDEAEVARAEDHRTVVRQIALLLLLARSRRLGRGVADHRVLLVAAGHRADAPLREVPLDEVVEAVAVALPEGCTLRLAVIRKDDELVWPRRVAAGALVKGALTVELPQRLAR